MIIGFLGLLFYAMIILHFLFFSAIGCFPQTAIGNVDFDYETLTFLEFLKCILVKEVGNQSIL